MSQSEDTETPIMTPRSESGPPTERPKILLMGLRRSGKSSIQKVVFHKMSPNETQFLESTTTVYKDDISSTSFMQFQIWDFPGQLDLCDPASDPASYPASDAASDTDPVPDPVPDSDPPLDYKRIFTGTQALIYVIDAQEDYHESLRFLVFLVSRCIRVNPNINIEVFIHKVDALSDDQKIKTQRDLHQRAMDQLEDQNLDHVQLSFSMTSVYDVSVLEAFSKVLQKLLPELPALENLLHILISACGIETVFLVDVFSKIMVSSDSALDSQIYEVCCDMMDLTFDLSCIYGMMPGGGAGGGCAFDSGSVASIRLNNNTVLYLKQVTEFLAVVCILREESYERRGLIDYNIHCFRAAVQQVLEVGGVSSLHQSEPLPKIHRPH